MLGSLEKGSRDIDRSKKKMSAVHYNNITLTKITPEFSFYLNKRRPSENLPLMKAKENSKTHALKT